MGYESNAHRIVVASALCAMLAACGGGDTGSPITSDPSPTPTGLYVGGASATVTNSGRTLTTSGLQLTIPSNALTGSAIVFTAKTSDPETHEQFEDALWDLPLQAARGNEEIRVKLEGARIREGATIMLRIAVPADIAAQATATQSPGLVRLSTFSIKDDDREESIDTVEALTSTYDPSVSTITAILDAHAFTVSSSGSLEAIVRVLPPASASSQANALIDTKRASSGALTSSASSAPACYNAPESAIEAKSYGNPLKKQLKIIGPYSEPGHSGSTHKGIDFKVGVGSTVHAVRSGYIERIRRSGCIVSAQGQPNQACSDLSRLFYAVVRHNDGTATRYLHLTADSVITLSGGTEILWALPSKTVAESQRSWVETNPCAPLLPVARGQKIALSGDTGSPGRQHLHFEAGSGSAGAGLLGNTFNPILKLGRIALSKASLTLPATEVVIVNVVDNDSYGEIVVRRKAPDIFLPVAAKSTDFPVYNPGSNAPLHYNWPVVDAVWSFETSSFGNALKAGSKIYPAYATTMFGVSTDGAGIQVDNPVPPVGSAPGKVTVELRAVRSATQATTGTAISSFTVETLQAGVPLSGSFTVHPNDLNDFRFEFVDVQGSLAATCTSVLGRNGNSPVAWSSLFADFDVCTKGLEPAVRCIGAACIAGRFFVAATSYTASYRFQDVPFPGSNGVCSTWPDETIDLVAQNRTSSTYPGTGWYGIGQTFANIYPSAPGYALLTGFPLSYKKNIVNIIFTPQYAGPWNAVCALTGHNYRLNTLVYDSIQNTYSSHSMNLATP